MRANASFILLIFVAAVLFQAASAGEIILSAEKPVIYSPPGEAPLQLNVTNTFGEDICGSFTWTLRDPDNPGNVQSFTDMRMIFSDQETVGFSVPRSDRENYLVDVSFDYVDRNDPDIAYLVRLEGIQLHFTEDTESVADNSYFPPLESVQTRITSGSLQQQSSSKQQSVANNEPASRIKNRPEDMASLSEFVESETVSLFERKKDLGELIQKSPVILELDRFLEGEGYKKSVPALTVGTGFLNDEFSMSYISENNTEIQLSGEVTGDTLLFVNASSPGKIPLMDCVSENKTYLSLDSQLFNEGFNVIQSYLNSTSEETSIRIFYEKGGLKKEIDIIVTDGVPVSVVLEDKDAGIHFLLPLMIVFITAVSAVVGYRTYRKYFPESLTNPPEDVYGISDEMCRSPSELLEKSHIDCMNGDIKEAFSKAGSALRLCISQKYNGGENLTNSQTLILLTVQNDPEYDQCSDILSVCDAVVYGNRKPDAEIFTEKYLQIKIILENDHHELNPGDD